MENRHDERKAEEGRGKSSSDSEFEGSSRGVGSLRGEGQNSGFSGAGGINPSDRSWTGIGHGSEGFTPGGIGSRLIAKLLEQRAEVLSRYEVVLQRKAEYEAKLEQIDREMREARQIVAECLGIEGNHESDELLPDSRDNDPV